MNEPARPTAVLHSGPCQVLPVLVHITPDLVPSLTADRLLCSIQRSWFRYHKTHLASISLFLREPCSLLNSCGARPHPAAGRMPCRAARSSFACHSPSGFAAGASRHPHDPGAPVPRLSSLALSHRFSPSGMERGMLARPRLRRAWRSRHRPSLRVRHTGLTALPWPLCGQRLRR